MRQIQIGIIPGLEAMLLLKQLTQEIQDHHAADLPGRSSYLNWLFALDWNSLCATKGKAEVTHPDLKVRVCERNTRVCCLRV